jgi:comEA protein
MINFTKEEKTVLIFLTAAAFLGIAVLYYKKVSLKPCEAGASFSKKTIFTGGKHPLRASININTASEKELTKLRGIGPVLAERIISYREKSGRFGRKEDIKKVKGVGDKIYENIKGEIRLE